MSAAALIQFSTFHSRGVLSKLVLVNITFSRHKTDRLKNKKGKYDLFNLKLITECACKFPYLKDNKYLTEEISCFVILLILMCTRADIASF